MFLRGFFVLAQFLVWLLIAGAIATDLYPAFKNRTKRRRVMQAIHAGL